MSDQKAVTGKQACRECGAAIPVDSVGGFCAQCLLALGLRPESGTEPSAVDTLASTVRSPIPLTEKAGDRIGRYRLLQEIGQGGCGVVYMAEQEEPVQRRVALKVIKLGMDTKQVVARFEAERQALAMMDHPNIAKVLDAGATETGRPYFVMELVRGIRITDYSDQNKLPTEERLKLFTQVCQAIQHAHQKGIIHRDIKPSNILVTLHDGKPAEAETMINRVLSQPVSDDCRVLALACRALARAQLNRKTDALSDLESVVASLPKSEARPGPSQLLLQPDLMSAQLLADETRALLDVPAKVAKQ